MVFLTLAHHFGWGRHFFYLTDEERVMSMEMEFISEPVGKIFVSFASSPRGDRRIVLRIAYTFRRHHDLNARPSFLYLLDVPTFRHHTAEKGIPLVPDCREFGSQLDDLHYDLHTMWGCQ